MNIIFIIAHKYIKGYESYIKYYVDNVNKIYQKADILIVDNNSLFKNEISEKICKTENVTFIENNSDSKFELGAYNEGLKWLDKNNLLNKYEYFIFTQDTFVLKNYFDFEKLKNKNVKACSIVSEKNDWQLMCHSDNILQKINMNDNLDKAKLCWCSSFIIQKEKINNIIDILSKIKITTRKQSEASERYLGRILWELNNKENYDIDGNIKELNYYCHTVNIYDQINNFFVKKAQQKNETTKDFLI